jgi:hypothetical protein
MQIECIGRLLCLLAVASGATAQTTEDIRFNGRVLARDTLLRIDGGPAVMNLSAGQCSTVQLPATAGTNVTILVSGRIPASISVYKPKSQVLATNFAVSAAADDTPDHTYDIRLLHTGFYGLQACSQATTSGTLKIAVARCPVDRFDIRLEMTQNPLTTGTDVSATHYRVRNLTVAQWGVIERASIQAKTAPTGGPISFSIWVSHDDGATWQSVLNNWELTAGSTGAETSGLTQFLTTEIRRGDLLRYDINTAGATTPGAGVEVTLTVGVLE